MKITNWVPVLLCSLAVTSPALADTRDDVLSGIARCNVIHDNRVWLDCVYGAQQPMRALLGLPAAPEYQQRLVPPPGSVPQAPVSAPPVMASATPQTSARPSPSRRGRAGFFGNLFGENPPVAVSHMTSYRFDRKGAFVVALENGQQWRQTDVEAGTASWTRPASSYEVTITQGAFGNYTLRTADNPRTFRVERIK